VADKHVERGIAAAAAVDSIASLDHPSGIP
jgi:hypothetical protein